MSIGNGIAIAAVVAAAAAVYILVPESRKDAGTLLTCAVVLVRVLA